VDATPILTWFSFDIIGTVAFGESLDMLEDPQYRWVPPCLRSASVFLYWAGYAPGLNFWRWFLSTSLPSLLGWEDIKNSQRYTDFADFMFHRRADGLKTEEPTRPAQRTDIFRHLIRSQLYNDLDMRADSSLLIAAGSDAIRLTLAATVFYWLKNPETFENAKQEIRSSAGSVEGVTDATLSSLRYVRACIDETMRLCPPKAASLPREVKAGGIEIDGVHVPEGMTVGTSVYALHHDAEIFPDPFAYNPERWLQQPQDRRMQAAFCPFLKGPRACPGKTVAYFAMQLALFHLLYRYDIRLASTEVAGGGHAGLSRLRLRKDEYHFNDWILGFAEGPVVELRARENA